MFEVPHDNTSKLTCMSNDASDQLGNPSSLRRVFFVSSVDSYYQKRLFFFFFFLQTVITDLTERMIRLIRDFAGCEGDLINFFRASAYLYLMKTRSLIFEMIV